MIKFTAWTSFASGLVDLLCIPSPLFPCALHALLQFTRGAFFFISRCFTTATLQQLYAIYIYAGGDRRRSSRSFPDFTPCRPDNHRFTCKATAESSLSYPVSGKLLYLRAICHLLHSTITLRGQAEVRRSQVSEAFIKKICNYDIPLFV